MLRRRRAIAEHPFGTLKERILGNGRLLLRGLRGARTEMALAVLAYNFKRVANILGPAAMANLLGDVWIDAGGTPHWAAALEDPSIRLHLYGKAEPRRGRKMGHLTAVAETVEEAAARVRRARERLVRG